MEGRIYIFNSILLIKMTFAQFSSVFFSRIFRSQLWCHSVVVVDITKRFQFEMLNMVYAPYFKHIDRCIEA